MEIITAFLEALPEAASNKFSFLAYVVVVISWFLLGWRIKRNKNLLAHIDKLPEKDRLRALELEMGVARLKQGLSPEQWIKVKAHQYILIGFSILCLAVVTVAAMAGFNAFGKVDVSMSLYNEPKDNSFSWLSDTTLQYHYNLVNDTINIVPKLKYLEDIHSGKTVDGLTWDPFVWSFPRLSLKISNNSNQTILITEVLFEVKNNQIDMVPVPYVHSENYYGTFAIHNDGWGEILSPSLNVSLSRPDKCSDEYVQSTAQSKIQIEDFYDNYSVSINEIITKELRDQLLQCTDEIEMVCIHGGYCISGGSDNLKCLDTEKSRECKEVSGALDKAQIIEMVQDVNSHLSSGEVPATSEDIFYVRFCQDDPACVFGELSYKTKEDKDTKFLFKTYVSLGVPLAGAAMPPSNFYDVFIRAGEPNQLVRLPVSHEIRPGESDHFVVNIASDKSASMEVNVIAINSDGDEIAQQKLGLNLFVSKAGLKYVRGRDKVIN